VSFPRFLKPAIAFDQPLQVFLVDGIIETLVRHSISERSDRAGEQSLALPWEFPHDNQLYEFRKQVAHDVILAQLGRA
jgi:hypothetical protein